MSLTMPSANAESILQFNVAAGQSSNIQRLPANETKENIYSVGTNFESYGETRRINWDISGDLDQLSYENDTYDDELVGSAEFQIQASLIPDWFQWDASYNFGQARTDVFDRITPENRSDVHFFTTGPIFQFELFNRVFLDLQGLYSTTTFEGEELDSERELAIAGLRRQLGSDNSLSLLFSTESIEFPEDPTGESDFDREALYLQWRAAGARTDLLIDAGATKITESSGLSDEGDLFGFRLRRQVSSAQTLTLTLLSSFADYGMSFREYQENTSSDGRLQGVEQGTQSVYPISDPYRNRSAYLTWSFDKRRTSATFEASYGDDEFEEATDFDRHYVYVTGRLARQFGNTFTLEALGSMRDETSQQSAKETEVELVLSARLSRRWTVSFSGARYERDSVDETTNFEENVYFLRLGFLAFDNTSQN